MAQQKRACEKKMRKKCAIFIGIKKSITAHFLKTKLSESGARELIIIPVQYCRYYPVLYLVIFVFEFISPVNNLGIGASDTVFNSILVPLS